MRRKITHYSVNFLFPSNYDEHYSQTHTHTHIFKRKISFAKSSQDVITANAAKTNNNTTKQTHSFQWQFYLLLKSKWC